MAFKKIILPTLMLAIGAAGGGWVYSKVNGKQVATDQSAKSIFHNAKYSDDNTSAPMVDFEKAATKAAPAVVHIKVVLNGNQTQEMTLDDFGDGNQNSAPAQRASGSGVIITSDGYIVTNNHVVERASDITVTLNDKNDYKAKVIGTDPSTDLAVIKIDARDLPCISFTNSDDVHIGQWVLAIGYPLNLETTVTSGIVSAKARNIGINSRNSSSAIESFIQTDAAVNPGNSGGALVNRDGELIGINSAIASPTGSYAGYSYAIPSNLVHRVASDLVKYGSAKRAYLGIMFPNDQMSQQDREKNNIKVGNGVYVMDVAQGSTAEDAGIQKGDFITKLNGVQMNSGTEVIGKIGSLKPGDKIDITFTHDGSEKTVTTTLKASAGTYSNANTRQQ